MLERQVVSIGIFADSFYHFFGLESHVSEEQRAFHICRNGNLVVLPEVYPFMKKRGVPNLWARRRRLRAGKPAWNFPLRSWGILTGRCRTHRGREWSGIRFDRANRKASGSSRSKLSKDSWDCSVSLKSYSPCCLSKLMRKVGVPVANQKFSNLF